MEKNESTQDALSLDADGVQEQNHEVLIDHFLAMLGKVCRERGLLPGDLFTGRRKTRRIAMAREGLVFALRNTVGSTKGASPRAYAIFPDGLDLFTHEPISYPVMGRLFGMDHTTMIQAYRRAERRKALEEAGLETLSQEDRNVQDPISST